MKKDRLKRCLPSLVCVFLAFGSAAALGQEKKIVLRVADAFPLGHYIAEHAAKYWMDAVKRSSGGAVDFEYYPAEQLGKAKDLLALTVSGVADVGYVAPSNVSDKMPLSAVAELPGGFPTSCAGTLAYWKIAKDGILAQKELEPNGVRLLFTLALAPYQIFARQKFDSLKSIEGLKIRTTGGAMDTTVRKLKAVSVKMPGPEINEALSRGTIDAGVFPYASVLSWKWDAHARFATVGENFGSFIASYVISETRWKKLPENVQKIMLEAGEAATRNACAQVDKSIDADIEKLQQRGVTLVKFSTADKKEIESLLATVSTEWAEALDKRGKPGSEALKAFRAALAQGGR